MKHNVTHQDMGRNYFSYEGLNALYDWLIEFEDDCNKELDVLELYCYYSEYTSALEAAKEYGYEPELGDCEIYGDEDCDETEESALEWLRDQTSVIEFDGGVIIKNF